MKRSFLVGMFVFLLGTVPSGLFAQPLTNEQVAVLLERQGRSVQFVPGEVIVKMRTTVGLAATDMSKLGLEVSRQASGGDIVYRIPATTTLSPSQSDDRTMAIVQQLQARDDVEYAQPNYILYISDTTPVDPRFGEQWHYMNNGTGGGQAPGGISLPQAWDVTTGSSGVRVAVIDTGILPNHPDIVNSPNIVAGFDMITDPARANDGDGRDSDPTDPGDAVVANECGPGEPPSPDSWHGTHVAGTVGVGRTNNSEGVAGVNWAATVQAVRVLGKCGGTLADINDGIRWAAGLAVPGVPNNPTPSKIINMSLGSPPGVPCTNTPSTQAAIDAAVAAGATVIVAAGNDAVDASQVFPASCNNVVTVAASDLRGRLVTRYSNFGSSVDILAPGGDRNRDDDGDGNNDGVLSMVQGGYDRYNGTSMAAPHVAGVAALYLAQDPGLTPAQLVAELKNNALPRDSTQCPQPCGAGLLSALRNVPTITLDIVPDSRLGSGDTAQLTATVTLAGAPLPGVNVTFSSADTNLATVSPGAALTDATGKARTTVESLTSNQTTVDVTAQAGNVSATLPVKVPDVSRMGLLFFIAVVILVWFGRRSWQRSLD